jgi:hypothetical protein
MTTALATTLQDRTDDSLVIDPTATGVWVTAGTRATYGHPGEATAAAEELLAEVLALGYRLRGGLVGAERCPGDGAGPRWRGELIDVLLGEDLAATRVEHLSVA